MNFFDVLFRLYPESVGSVYNYHRTEPTKETLAKLNYSWEETQNDAGEKEYKLKPLSFDLVLSRFQKLLNGKVVNINDELVVLPDNPEGRLFALNNATDVFSYLGTAFKGIPDWRHGQGYMSKDELFRNPAGKIRFRPTNCCMMEI